MLSLTLVFACVFAGLAWQMICNRQTFLDRQAIIKALSRYRGDDWRQLAADFEAVTYGRHLWRRTLLIDPMPFYGERINQLMTTRVQA